MRKFILSAILSVFLLMPSASVFARGKHSHHTLGSHTSRYTTGVKRDSHGHIKRSEKARKEFMKQTGYPHGRKGYVIDHIVLLKRGGSDTPDNMQWQTKEEARLKDKTE